MLLSILVCTIKSRQLLCGRLLGILRPQLERLQTGMSAPPIELLLDEDDGDVPIGQKRNRLLEQAVGEYLCFIDDDDTVADDYVSSIVEAIQAQGTSSLGLPDCIGFRANWYEDGKQTADATYSIRNEKRREVLRGERYVVERQPGHLTPVRRELALAVGFEPWSFGEDADFSIRLRPYLKTEVFVDKVLYHYWLRTREAREHEKVHPTRWSDSNFRIERSLGAALNRRNNTVPAVIVK